MQEFAGIKIPQSLVEIITPHNTAFIVYDMQAGIVAQIKNGPEITHKLSRVLAAARRAGVRTFFTRHMSLPKGLMGAFPMRTAMAWQHVDSPRQSGISDRPGVAAARERGDCRQDHDVGL